MSLYAPPLANDCSSVREIIEVVIVQTFIPKLAVAAFDVSILRWFASGAITAEIAHPSHVRHELRRRTPCPAYLDLLSHLNHHEVLPDLDGSCVSLARGRDQVLLCRNRLNDVRIHSKLWSGSGKHFSSLLGRDMMLDHRPCPLGMYAGPLESFR
jgi:hypothetical protein